jgi:hypothetical protein
VDLIRNWLRTTHGASIDETYEVLDELGRGKIFITVIAYQLDGKNSKSDLTALAEQTLAGFDLTASSRMDPRDSTVHHRVDHRAWVHRTHGAA